MPAVRRPVTADGRLTQARTLLPGVESFKNMRRALVRVMTVPGEVVVRVPVSDPRDVDIEHRYTPAERGEILSFAWWVYINRSRWPRTRLSAAVTVLSPTMMFSSAFLSEMTGMPQATVKRHMIRPPGMSIARVTGSCDPWVVHRLLEVSGRGVHAFRGAVRDLTLLKDVPKALMARLSGVPLDVLLRPDRGVQFFPESPDCIFSQVCDPVRRVEYASTSRPYDPLVGDQREVREAFAGTPLIDLRPTSSPVPDENSRPFFTTIPGLPKLSDMERLGHLFHGRVHRWEFSYHLPASLFVGPGA